MRHIVGRILVLMLLLASSAAYLSFTQPSLADPAEHVYYLHAESTSGISVYLDLERTNPEPNPDTVSVDVPNLGQYKLGDGWIQNDNFYHSRDVRGTWTFTMYVYCDDDIINGQLYAKVFDGFSTRLNGAQNRSELIGPCSNPSSPVEVVWDDVLDHAQAQSLVQNERFRVEIWLDAVSGGTSGGIKTATSEISKKGHIVNGSYLNTTAANEGVTPFEILQEDEVPCGNTTLFEVVGENGVVGKSISGDYTNLAANDESFEEVGEDDNPNSLEWIWNIDIAPGTGQYSFYLDAVINLAPANDDDFDIEYSTTGAFAGEEQLMFTVNESWVGSFSDPPPARYDFPAGSLSGVSTVYIRAIDTNLTDWPQLKDVLKIDRMYIEHVEAGVNCSAFEHIWVIGNLPTATSHRVYVNAYQVPEGDSDQFRFSYSSISSLGPFVNLFTITNTTDEDYYYNAPVSGPPGFPTLWLKAVDTDRTPGSPTLLDGLFVDHIYLNTTGGGTPHRLHLIIDDAVYSSRIKTVEDISTDTVKPSSRVLPLPMYSGLTFDVEFNASDTGSGIHHVELWYILDDDTHVQYPGAYTTSPITFTAPQEGRYRFYTRAVDNALNYEDRPATFDAATTVDLSSPTVTDVSPDDTSTGVSRTTSITIRFSESMNSQTVDAAFRLREEGGRTWRASDGRVTWNHPVNNTFIFRLPLGEEFDWSTEYTVTVGAGAEDLAGFRMAHEFRSTFETESEFNPGMLLLISVICILIMLGIVAYYMFLKKKPEEEEKIEEAVQPQEYPAQPAQPQEYPAQPAQPQEPMSIPIPPPAYAAPPPGAPVPPPLWQTQEPVQEMWREDRAALSACLNCGRFIPNESTFCPFCGVRRR